MGAWFVGVGSVMFVVVVILAVLACTSHRRRRQRRIKSCSSAEGSGSGSECSGHFSVLSDPRGQGVAEYAQTSHQLPATRPHQTSTPDTVPGPSSSSSPRTREEEHIRQAGEYRSGQGERRLEDSKEAREGEVRLTLCPTTSFAPRPPPSPLTPSSPWASQEAPPFSRPRPSPSPRRRDLNTGDPQIGSSLGTPTMTISGSPKPSPRPRVRLLAPSRGVPAVLSPTSSTMADPFAERESDCRALPRPEKCRALLDPGQGGPAHSASMSALCCSSSLSRPMCSIGTAPGSDSVGASATSDLTRSNAADSNRRRSDSEAMRKRHCPPDMVPMRLALARLHKMDDAPPPLPQGRPRSKSAGQEAALSSLLHGKAAGPKDVQLSVYPQVHSTTDLTCASSPSYAVTEGMFGSSHRLNTETRVDGVGAGRGSSPCLSAIKSPVQGTRHATFYHPVQEVLVDEWQTAGRAAILRHPSDSRLRESPVSPPFTNLMPLQSCSKYSASSQNTQASPSLARCPRSPLPGPLRTVQEAFRDGPWAKSGARSSPPPRTPPPPPPITPAEASLSNPQLTSLYLVTPCRKPTTSRPGREDEASRAEMTWDMWRPRRGPDSRYLTPSSPARAHRLSRSMESIQPQQFTISIKVRVRAGGIMRRTVRVSGRGAGEEQTQRTRRRRQRREVERAEEGGGGEAQLGSTHTLPQRQESGRRERTGEREQERRERRRARRPELLRACSSEEMEDEELATHSC